MSKLNPASAGGAVKEEQMDEVLFDDGEAVEGVPSGSGSGTSRTSASAGEEEGSYGRRSPSARV